MTRAWLALFLSWMLCACGAGQLSSSGVASGDDDALTSPAVKVLAQGNWSEVLACSGQCVSRYHFWADLQVRNDAFQKDVGARWTKDGWQTIQVAQASYVSDLGGGFEKWHLEAVIGEGTSAPSEVEFAVYATMNGTTSWDPNNNYYVYQSVSADLPVRLLHSGVTYASSSGVSFNGAVRVFDLGYAKSVFVRYSTDGWQTWKEVAASWSTANDWTFKAKAIASGKPLPADVQFAVRYDVAGQEFWDNNGGANYRLALEPAFTANTSWVPGLQNLAGIITLGSGWVTDLPVSGDQARLDSKSWQSGSEFTFSTLGLRNGAHQVDFKVQVQGGYTATSSVSFTVKNHITPLDSWQPPYVNASPGSVAPWSMAAGSDGKIYVVWSDGRIARYDAWAQTTAPTLYDAPANIQGIAVDTQGRTYGYAVNGGFTLYRFDTNGHLDPSFGAGGALDLNSSFDGSSICYVSAVSAFGSGAQVADSCNERVLDFDASGSFVNATSIPGATAIVSLGVANGSLWAANEDGLARLDASGAGLTLGARLPVAGLNGPAGIASAGGRTWIVDNISRLSVLNTDGSIAASWLGGTGRFGLQGEIPLARGLAALPDGTLAVVATDDGALVRFSSTLH